MVALAPVDDRQLVIAPAGSGKTHVLVARLVALIDEGLEPGSDILMLSFSRAAVAEVRRRIRARGDVAYVRLSTFDSYASALLASWLPSDDWSSKGYDERIQLAQALLEADEDAAATVSGLQHVLIDEAQDLVAVRSSLVETILRLVGGGFTVLADPAQRIYDFQAPTGSQASVATWLQQTFGEQLHLRRLSANFRARSEITRAVLQFGPRLERDGADYAGVRRDLDGFLLGLPSVQDLRPMLPLLTRQNAGSTAVLCRTNAQAYVVSERLWDWHVAHALMHAATEPAVTGDIAVALGGFTGRTIGRDRFVEQAAARADAETARQWWGQLRQLDGRPGRDVDLAVIRRTIAEGGVPQDLTVAPDAAVTVSTIHRAKGLEYDHVAVVEPTDLDQTVETHLAVETRALYVALTRARDDLVVVDPPDTRGLVVARDLGSRWVRRAFGKARRITGIEIRREDVDPTQPAAVQRSAGGAAAQEYLWTRLRAGDPVTLARQTGSPEWDPAFDIVHDGVVVGRTSSVFAQVIRRACGTRVPSSVVGLRVQGVETVVGDPVIGRTAGLGDAGVWLGVRLQGIGVFEDGESM